MLEVEAFEYLNQVDHVRAHTDPTVNQRIDRDLQGRLLLYANQPSQVISRRIEELDREWDVERMLEIQAGVTALLGLALGLKKNKNWFWLTGINQYFLTQHAVQGWCPPMVMYRRMGVRTRREIDVERMALKALRGDFRHVPEPAAHMGEERRRSDPKQLVTAALEAAIANNGYLKE